MPQDGLVRHDVSLPTGGRWLDLDLAHPRISELLADLIPEWGLLRSNFLAEGAPVGYLEHEGGIYLGFRGADLNSGGVPEELIAVRAWCSGDLVVTAAAPCYPLDSGHGGTDRVRLRSGRWAEFAIRHCQALGLSLSAARERV